MQFSLLSFQPVEEEEEKKKQLKRKADIMKCKRPSDRSGSAQFVWLRFECSLSAMECAYNSSPLEYEAVGRGGTAFMAYSEGISDWSSAHMWLCLCLCLCVCALCFSSCEALSLVTCLVSSCTIRCVASLSNLPLPAAHYSISFGVSISPAFPFPFLQFLHFRLVRRMWQSMKYFTRDLPGLASTATATWLGLAWFIVLLF